MNIVTNKTHAQKWLALYDSNRRQQLLNNLSRTEQGCDILLSCYDIVLPPVINIDAWQTQLSEERKSIIRFLENELLHSSYDVIPATRRLENVLAW